METEFRSNLKINPVIVDLGIGNVASLINAFRFVGVEGTLSSDEAHIREATHIVLPGVGAFDAAMQEMERLKLQESIRQEVIENRKPIIGICLGMQLLFESSDEGECRGLGLLPGNMERLSSDNGSAIKVPHAGFSPVILEQSSGFFNGLNKTESFYFTHSYALRSDSVGFASADCDYGFRFTAAFKYENIYGAQFHPEKSQSAGLRCLVNFLGDGE